MPDSAAVEQEGAGEDRYKPGRGVIALMAIPIVALIVLSNIGNAVAPTLVNSHPLALLALNSQNRTLILTTNHLDAWSYYLVGSLRLLVSDPLFFLLGYWYGDTAIDWMEGRTRSLGKAVRQWD